MVLACSPKGSVRHEDKVLLHVVVILVLIVRGSKIVRELSHPIRLCGSDRLKLCMVC
jgi:hypothetical protein